MTNKITSRSSGVLLHISSLPSKELIGDLGEAAYDFVDFLVNSGQTYWQILPINPVGYGYSPYQCFSAFAGNPLFVNLEKLLKEGYLDKYEFSLPDCNNKEMNQINFSKAEQYKFYFLDKAAAKFRYSGGLNCEDYLKFKNENEDWLFDYALFMALKDYFQGLPWYSWDEEIAHRQEQAIENYWYKLNSQIEFYMIVQYWFFKQWRELLAHAKQKNIRIIGDIPIFVAHDSADTWVNRQLFYLDDVGYPTHVSGVPPDYFSEKGQLWGNPLYNWSVMKDEQYHWWVRRLQVLLELVDTARIDHFRGFEAYWEIPGSAETAVKGQWIKGPGDDFFAQVQQKLGDLPFIAENLGIITDEVEKMRDNWNLPGMNVLMFLLEGGGKELFSALFSDNNVLYTGTHDNDTLVGWLQKGRQGQHDGLDTAARYLQIEDYSTDMERAWKLMEVIGKSHSNLVIYPMQDVLGLDNWARMNIPGTIGGNWGWRMLKAEMSAYNAEMLRQLTIYSDRYNKAYTDKLL